MYIIITLREEIFAKLNSAKYKLNRQFAIRQFNNNSRKKNLTTDTDKTKFSILS